jgi:hypothetical protein
MVAPVPALAQALPLSPLVTLIVAADAVVGAEAGASAVAENIDAEIVDYGRGQIRQISEISAPDMRLCGSRAV